MRHVGYVIHAEVQHNLVSDVELHVLEHPVGVAGRGQGTGQAGEQKQDQAPDHVGQDQNLLEWEK